jgi:hypothetical protein
LTCVEETFEKIWRFTEEKWWKSLSLFCKQRKRNGEDEVKEFKSAEK